MSVWHELYDGHLLENLIILFAADGACVIFPQKWSLCVTKCFLSFFSFFFSFLLGLFNSSLAPLLKKADCVWFYGLQQLQRGQFPAEVMIFQAFGRFWGLFYPRLLHRRPRCVVHPVAVSASDVWDYMVADANIEQHQSLCCFLFQPLHTSYLCYRKY